MRLSLIQDTDTHKFTHSTPKSHETHKFTIYTSKPTKYILLMSLPKSLGFLKYKERERMENQFTSYKYQFPVLPYDKC